MGDLQWNLLNTNAPAQVAASFNPLGAFNEGQKSAMELAGGRQKMQMNDLAMDKTRQDMEYAPMKIYAGMMGKEAAADKNIASANKMGIEAQIKAQELRRVSADTVANTPDELRGQAAMELATKNAQLLGLGEEHLAKAHAHIQQVLATKGPAGLREEALLQSQDAKLRLAESLGQGKLEQGGQRLAMQQQQGDTRNQIAATNAQTGQGRLAWEKEKFPQTLAINQQKTDISQERLAQGQQRIDNQAGQFQQTIGLKEKVLEEKIKAAEAKGMVPELSDEEINTLAITQTYTGRPLPLGRGAAADKLRMKLASAIAKQALGVDPGDKRTPTEAALGILQKQTDTKAIQGSLGFLEKQVSSMGSFVSNLNSQVDKVGELAKEIETFDSRLLNVPLRAIKGRVAGSAMQAKYDMYLTEIENEIGKLASGSTASIAELSVGAQEKWAKIHDKNLSIKDMMSLLEETKNAANMRVQSVNTELGKARKRMVDRDYSALNPAKSPVAAPKVIGRFQIEEE